jgi:hypothetical protein
LNGSSLELDEVSTAEATVVVDCEVNELAIVLEDEETAGIEAEDDVVDVISVLEAADGCGEGTKESAFKGLITPAP